MNKRSEQLKNLRPEIHVDNSKSTDLETFQTNTLRPILKFQKRFNTNTHQPTFV